MTTTTPEMQQGKNKILLFRRLADANNKNAAKLVFQTEHTFSFSRALDKITTKDGTLIKVGELESEVSISAILAKNNETSDMLRSAMMKGEKLEVWEVNVDEDLKVGEQYPAIYCRGHLGSWETPSNVDDQSTISTTLVIEFEPQFGMATLTAEQQEEVQYAFRDTIETNEEPED